MTLLLCLPFLPLNSYASQLIYTIQTGSFVAISPAQKHFDSIIHRLNKEELEYLRIEKVEKFYSVRIGKFKDRAAAERFLKVIKPQLPTAIIIKAYIIDKRIARLYKGPLSDRKAGSLENRIEVISNLVGKQEYEKALEVIRAEIIARPESPELNGWYGTVLLKMNQPAKAIKYFRKAVELSPRVSDYHNGIGYCLVFLNRFDEAIDEFNRAVTLDPAHIDALTGLGITYVKIGKKDKAMGIYKKLKGLDKHTANKLLKIIEGKTL